MAIPSPMDTPSTSASTVLPATVKNENCADPLYITPRVHTPLMLQDCKGEFGSDLETSNKFFVGNVKLVDQGIFSSMVPHLADEIKTEPPDDGTNQPSVQDINVIDESTTVCCKPYFRSLKSFVADTQCTIEVCRICFCSLDNEESIRLYENSDQGVTEIKNMLQSVLPDLDLQFYQHPVICIKCKEFLESSYKLKEAWLKTEENLKKILEEEQKKGVVKPDADIVVAPAKKNTGVLEKMPSSDIVAKIKRDSILRDRAITRKKISSSEITGKLLPTKNRFYYHMRKVLCNELGIKRKQSRFKAREKMCEQCGFLCTTLGSLKAHLKTHKTLECHLCKKIFVGRRNFHVHNETVHLKFQCDMCGKVLVTKNRLRQHMLTHGQRRYVCQICEKQFIFWCTLKSQVHRVHTNKLHECEYCGRLIKFEKCLKRHIEMYHTKEAGSRPSYENKSNLVKHKVRIQDCGPDVKEIGKPK